jgi:hypothetical protein
MDTSKNISTTVGYFVASYTHGYNDWQQISIDKCFANFCKCYHRLYGINLTLESNEIINILREYGVIVQSSDYLKKVWVLPNCNGKKIIAAIKLEITGMTLSAVDVSKLFDKFDEKYPGLVPNLDIFIDILRMLDRTK